MTRFAGLSKGAAWEYRLHRALFVTGWYVRRNVDLRERIAGSPQTMAEIDLFGLSFDPSLRACRLIGECKDRKGSTKEADRVIWLLGLARLLDGDSLVFAKTRIAAATIQFARSTDVALLDEARINKIEDDIGELWVGAFDPQLATEVVRPAVSRESFGDVRLREAYDWIHNGSWYERPFPRLKRLHNYFRLVDRYAAGRTRAVMIVEGLLGLLASTLEASGHMRRFSPEVGRALGEDALGAGAAGAPVLRDIAARADDYYLDVVQQLFAATNMERPALTVPRLADHIAEPPSWTPAFLALAEQVSERPERSTGLLRFAELELYERFLANRDPGDAHRTFVDGETGWFSAALALVATFCQRAWGFEDEIITRLRTGQPDVPARASSDGANEQSHGRRPAQRSLLE